MWVHVTSEAEKIPWHWSNRQLWVIPPVWMTRTKLRSSGTAVCTPNCWAISPSHYLYFLKVVPNLCEIGTWRWYKWYVFTHIIWGRNMLQHIYEGYSTACGSWFSVGPCSASPQLGCMNIAGEVLGYKYSLRSGPQPGWETRRQADVLKLLDTQTLLWTTRSQEWAVNWHEPGAWNLA